MPDFCIVTTAFPLVHTDFRESIVGLPKNFSRVSPESIIECQITLPEYVLETTNRIAHKVFIKNLGPLFLRNQGSGIQDGPVDRDVLKSTDLFNTRTDKLLPALGKKKAPSIIASSIDFDLGG